MSNRREGFRSKHIGSDATDEMAGERSTVGFAARWR